MKGVVGGIRRTGTNILSSAVAMLFWLIVGLMVIAFLAMAVAVAAGLPSLLQHPPLPQSPCGNGACQHAP